MLLHTIQETELHEGASLSVTRQQTTPTRGDDPALADKLLAAHDTAVQMFAAIESKGALLWCILLNSNHSSIITLKYSCASSVIASSELAHRKTAL